MWYKMSEKLTLLLAWVKNNSWTSGNLLKADPVRPQEKRNSVDIGRSIIKNCPNWNPSCQAAAHDHPEQRSEWNWYSWHHLEAPQDCLVSSDLYSIDILFCLQQLRIDYYDNIIDDDFSFFYFFFSSIFLL